MSEDRHQEQGVEESMQDGGATRSNKGSKWLKLNRITIMKWPEDSDRPPSNNCEWSCRQNC